MTDTRSSADDPGPDLDTYALASMIADHLRGIPIDPAELPAGAHRLVAAYVAKHDHGGSVLDLGQLGPIRFRFVARDHTGTALPDVPTIRRGEPRVIDADPAVAPHTTLAPVTVVSAPHGQLPDSVAQGRNRHG